MATTVAVIQATRRSPFLHLRLFSSKPSHHREHSQNHVYLEPTNYIGSFLKDQTPKNPEQAAAKLALLRREYAMQVKGLRKQYIEEMELQHQEQLRKDEARKQEIIRQREERKKSKAVAAQARAAQRKAFEEDLRLTLMKEKTEKLEYWRMREKTIADKKKSKKELICKQSSMWLDETQLETKVMEAMANARIF